jgi:hypothetical protein
VRIISASTSARRYLGLLASLRTSGSRPRRAQVATAAEVTPNSDATSLRVIRLSFADAGAVTFIKSPAGLSELSPGQRDRPVRLLPGNGPGPDARRPVALKVSLQLAPRDIGQLTDIESDDY